MYEYMVGNLFILLVIASLVVPVSHTCNGLHDMLIREYVLYGDIPNYYISQCFS